MLEMIPGKPKPVSVFMECPLTGKMTEVFWPVIVIDGNEYVDKNKFNGCDTLWGGCSECKACQVEAYKKLFGK